MTYIGHIRDGVAVFDGLAPPDGTAVRVEVVPDPGSRVAPGGNPAIAAMSPAELKAFVTARREELLKQSAAECGDGGPSPDRWAWVEELPPPDLPPDAASQVDHYLYGHPKK